MSTWTVGSLTFADPAGMSNDSGIVAGKYWHSDVEVLTPVYERRLFGYPGVNGLAVKAFGFRGRIIRGSVIYFAADLATLRAAIEADRAALANLTFATTPPDGSVFANCQLEALPDGAVSPAAPNLLMMSTVLTVMQLRN